MGLNAMAFGGGGLVGTCEALGHTLGLDQVVRPPAERNFLKKSFFDYMRDAGVPLRHLDVRIDDVMASIPEAVLQGEDDVLRRCFPLTCGISGGSVLAAGMAADIPIVRMVHHALTFPLRAYFTPDFKEYVRCARRLPEVPLRVADIVLREFDLSSLWSGGTWKGLRTSLTYLSKLTFELMSAWGVVLPRGVFTGEGIEEFVRELTREYGKGADTFEAIRRRGKHLLVIADRFNHADILGDTLEEGSVCYYGLPPYDTLDVSKAIRASCSIPGITTPFEFYDTQRGQEYVMSDGAIGKTLGRREILRNFDVDCLVTINPIVPYRGRLSGMMDILEQLYRKLIYSRIKAVERYTGKEDRSRVLNLQSSPQEFYYNMFRIDKMKEGVFEGYYQTLKTCAENYIEVNKVLAHGGLTLIPRNEIFRLVMDSNTVRERAYVRRAFREEASDETFWKKLNRFTRRWLKGEEESKAPKEREKLRI